MRWRRLRSEHKGDSVTEHPFDEWALVLHEEDDVAVARKQIPRGLTLSGLTEPLTATDDIAAGHKIALRDVRAGEPLKKYGQIIGFASAAISAGSHVHTHNLEIRDFGRDYQFCAETRPVEYCPVEEEACFQGYLRPDGRVGTRNYLAVVSTVNCSATVCRHIAERFRGPDALRDFPNVDGVLAVTHQGGCTTPPGESMDILRRLLVGFARHPNVFGYVLVGLGCEGNQIPGLVRDYSLADTREGEPPPTFLTIQHEGGTAKTVAAGVAAVEKLLPLANAVRRTKQPAGKIVLGQECGGSDANSGITANPAVGVASDELVRHRGTAVLAETPEIYGAEHLLTRRAVSREVGEKLIALIRWWEDYARRHNASIDNNPSPGNKEGGLTTIYEKSLGAVSKAGQSPLAAVYGYGEQVDTPGMCFMDTPGYDAVSMTGLVAGGCNVCVFTTGRGTVYGLKPAPCIKVATISPMFEHMQDDMDLNAGTVLDGTETIQEVGRRLFDKIVAVASGERTKSELAGIGDQEFAPWDLGPTF